MSRNDRRRNSHSKNWNGRDSGEKNERQDREERLDRSRGRDMRNDRRDRSDRKNQHESRGSASYERRQERRRFVNPVSQQEIQENENAIRSFKEKTPVCPICGEAITDIANALLNRGDNSPVHFDCVLKKITEEEKPGPSEKVAYIGQGRFALLTFENPHDQKHFTIKKIIEWENRESERGEWRNEMAGLFSQVR